MSAGIGMQNAERVLLNVAGGHHWVRETNGANRGEVVDQIIRACGLDPASRPPWCAMFVAYIGRLVLTKSVWPLKPWAGCASLAVEAEQLGLLFTVPARGAVFLLWSEKHNRFNHCGFVGELVTPGTLGRWHTVEGNTSPDGSPEGTGVFARQRTFSPKDRFIWWWHPTTSKGAV